MQENDNATWLTPQEIARLCGAAERAGIADELQRLRLLVGPLSPSLPEMARPVEQLLSDVMELNRWRVAEPLRGWLDRATEMTRGRPESETFADLALNVGRRAAAGRPSDGSPRRGVPAVEAILGRVERRLLTGATSRPSPGFLRAPTDPSVDGGDERVGWGHWLEDNAPLSTIATAFGLRTLAIVGALQRPDASSPRCRTVIRGAVRTLDEMRLADGAWKATSQMSVSRPESTAFVLWGMSPWRVDRSSAELIAPLEALLDARRAPDVDPQFWRSTYLVALVLRVLAELHPTSPWVGELAQRLRRAGQRSDGRLRGWSRTTNGSAKLTPLHTAHALIALLDAHRATDGREGLSPDESRSAGQWLVDAPSWPNISERISRPHGEGTYDTLTVGHFTSPWVSIALVRLGGEFARHPSVHRAIGRLVDEEQDGAWPYHGSVPIWAQHDAAQALLVYALDGGA